jgi:cytochrome P450
LVSTIATARIDGAPLSDVDTACCCVIIATAGHDTTSAAIGGGLLAPIEHPDQRNRLHADLGLMPTAVEEIIRWVTPVKEFMRTATADTEVHGVPIAEGESAHLSYVSADRDEDVFANPFTFAVGRDPNKHLSFGYGAHFCVASEPRHWPGWRSAASSPSCCPGWNPSS